MVQKPPPRKRGRPPAYHRETALRQAGETFWDAGYSATTLDELSAATGMNRPSLYGAFGDKHTLYLETLARYATASHERLDAFLRENGALADQLMAVYDGALAIYGAGEAAPRGCFLVGTALTEAVGDATIRTPLREALQRLDAAFEVRFRRAVADGELAADSDPKALAQIAGAMLNALAVRARSGEALARLRTTAKATVRLVCGPGPTAGGARRKGRVAKSP